MFKLIAKLYRKLLYDSKLIHKIMLTYLILIIIPLGFFQWIASSKITSILEKHVLYSAEQGFEQTVSFLSYKLEKISEATDVVVINPTVVEILETHAYRSGIGQQLDDYKWLKRFLRSLQNEDISRVMLFVSDSLIFANDKDNFYPLRSDEDSDCIRRLTLEKDKYLWCAQTEMTLDESADIDHIYLVRNIRHSNNYLLPIGRVKLEVENQTIQEILIGSNVIKDSITYLQAPDNTVIVASGIVPHEEIPIELSGSAFQSTLETVSVKEGERYYLSRSIPASQWMMVTSIPLKEIVSEGEKLKRDLYLLVLFIAAVAHVLAYILAHSITRRISHLIRSLRDVERGNLHSLRRLGGKDEIGQLIRSYNLMIDRIEHMNQEQFKLGQEVKNAELRALQSQINPHFLYNTLDLINWMANKGMNQEIRRVIKALSRFYKLSLNNGNETIAIQDELSHVQFYMEIQNTRFENKIVFVTDVDEEILDCTIPKITLQPIVENAVFHGILGRTSRSGTVSISGRLAGSELILTVKDDGVGMSEQRLYQLLLEEAVDEVSGDLSGSGYGVKNVRQRISHYFGDGYGLAYRSVLGEGTEVEIRIPAIKRTEI